jgi:hypothetical protein
VKRVLIAMMVLCVETPLAMGQSANVVNSSRSNIKNNLTVSQGTDGKTHCTVANKPCAKEDVEKLNAALASRNAAADQAAAKAAGGATKSGVKSVALAPDGSLTCVTIDGKKQPCAAAHVVELNNAAAAMPGANDGIHGVGIGLGKKPDPSKPSK